MSLPLEALATTQREVGLVVAVGIGVGFGFVLERAGFGRAPKLAAQFYFRDLTVLKVMFSGIVTAMLGLVVLGGLGVIDLRALSETAVSATNLWPMVIGGLLLGVGFIVSGYCPGTSIVAAASGKVDGVFTVVGVIAGTWVYSELMVIPAVAKFHQSGDLGTLLIWQWLKVPPAAVAAGVVVMALGMFVGGEALERWSARRRGVEPSPAPRAPRRIAFAAMGTVAALGLVTLALPHRTRAEARTAPQSLAPRDLAGRVLEAPWTLRILDLRPQAECMAKRIPGAECAPPEVLAKLGLKDDPGVRDLVLVGPGALAAAPPAAASYPGRVLLLEGGFAGWTAYALTRPALPAAAATPAELAEYQLRAAVNAALTGMKPSPPPPPAAGGAPVKKKGGGCSS
ncbi:MAG: YeeE/YedE family protein [Deltaproteobacteria bacterium]|nr:YeeE/YedE family protein [Deltaproteobacteria bacterium]